MASSTKTSEIVACYTLAPFHRAKCTWLQEEPENQGAWPYLRAELAKIGVPLCQSLPFVGRPSMSVTAGGSIERHEREQQEILSRIVDLGGT